MNEEIHWCGEVPVSDTMQYRHDAWANPSGFVPGNYEQASTGRAAIYQINGEVVGVIWFGAHGAITISGVGVRLDWRRRGVGTCLYRKAARLIGVRLEDIPPPSDLSAAGLKLRSRLGMQT